MALDGQLLKDCVLAVDNFAMRSLDDLQAFVAVVDARGFSEAARRLRLTTAAVSKAVARLEAELSVRLLTRTTRKVEPTAEGWRFYEHAADIVGRVDEAYASVHEAAVGAAGAVRLTAPVLFGQAVLLPWLARMAPLNPGLTLDVQLTDDFVDLVGQRIDLALRLGELADSSLVSRQVASTRMVTCAAPSYLQARGTPRTIDELDEHACVGYAFQRTGRIFEWRFRDGKTYQPHKHSLVVNDGGANAGAGACGAGFIQEVSAAVQPLLDAGTLVEVLREESAEGPPLHLVRSYGRHVPYRVRAVEQQLLILFESWR